LNGVFCTVSRDNSTGNLNEIWVRLYETSPSDTSCSLYSRASGSSSYDVETFSTSSTGFVELNVSLTDFTEYDYGAYILACSLHTNDAFRSVRTEEA
jgi:hypothetical protein